MALHDFIVPQILRFPGTGSNSLFCNLSWLVVAWDVAGFTFACSLLLNYYSDMSLMFVYIIYIYI